MTVHDPSAPIEIVDASSGCGGACGCGGSRVEADVLDARLVPHSVRHAVVLAAVGALPPGAALVLLAPHEPLPLLAQISDAYGGTVAWSYDETGPETWAVRFVRS